MPMKSLFFRSFDPNREGNKTFVGDLRSLMALPPERRSQLASAEIEKRLLLTEEEKRQYEDRLFKLFDAAQEIDARAGAAVLSNYCDWLSRHPDWIEDSPEAQADDLVDLGLIDASQSRGYAEIARDLLTLAKDKLLPALLRKRTERGVLPSLSSLGVTVEMRALVDPLYKWPEVPTDYSPKIRDLVPVVSLSLGATGREAKFFVQLSEGELSYLLSNLEAARKDLAALKSYVDSNRRD